MNLAVKISYLSSGLFLLAGMFIGIVKHQRMLNGPEHIAPAYIDIPHRAAFLYSFAMLVIAKLSEYSPYSRNVQLAATGSVLVFLTVTILGYFTHGIRNRTDNLFQRHFSTTWYVYMLTVGEITGLAIIVWGFISTSPLGKGKAAADIMEPDRYFIATAQISLAIAGFAGIVAAYRNESLHEWTEVERFWLRLQLLNSILPFTFSLAGIFFLATGLYATTGWGFLSGFAAVCLVPYAVMILRKLRGFAPGSI